MKEAGQIVLFEFPRGDLTGGKLRPALLLNKLPGPYDTWMICMISSKLDQKINGFDEVVSAEDSDFNETGLKTASLIRLGRLAVVDTGILEGTVGSISSKRLQRLKTNLADWLMGKAEKDQ
jgi:mRNA interferase MazF